MLSRCRSLRSGFLKLFFVLSTLLAISSSLYLLSQFKQGYLELEEKASSEAYKRVEEILEQQEVALAEKITDWADWDDSFDYVQTKSPKFEESNLKPEVLESLKVHALVYFNSTMSIQSINTESGAISIEEAQKLGFDFVKPDSPLMKNSAVGKSTGLVSIKSGLAFVVAAPVRRSDKSGSAGRIIFMRHLDENVIENIRKQSRQQIQLRTGISTAPADSKSMEPRGIRKHPTLVKETPINSGVLRQFEDRYEAEIPLQLMTGETAGHLIAIVEREISAFGRQTSEKLIYLMFIVLVSALTSISLATMFAIAQRNAAKNKEIIARLGEAQAIAKLQDFEFDLNSLQMLFTGVSSGLAFLNAKDSISLNEFLSLFDSDEAVLIENCLRGTHSTQNSFEIETRLKSIQGATEFLHIRMNRKLRDDGTVAVVGTIQDITSQKRLELTVAKERAYAQQSAKLASIGELSAGVAHEINNPLGVILGTVVPLLENYAHVEGLIPKLERIERSSQKIAKIVGGLNRSLPPLAGGKFI